MSKKPKNKVQFHVMLEHDQYNALKQIHHRIGVPVAELIRRAITDLLTNWESLKNKGVG